MVTTREKISILSAAESGAGTFTSSWLPSKDLEKLAVFLYMNTTAGSGSDTLDIILEQAPTNDATVLSANPHYIRPIPLKDQVAGTITRQLTQVVGGTSLPADTSTATILRQAYDIDVNNLDTYFRARRVVAGSASNLGIVNLTIVADKKL